jgi:hypothetical protein
MFRTEKSVGILQAVAAIAGLAVLLWSLGLPSLRLADAANLTFVSDTLSDSASSTVSNHDIGFTIPAAGTPLGAGDTITITFPDGASDFDLSNLGAATDFDFASSSDYTVVLGAPGAGQWGVATSTFDIVFTAGAGVSIATGTALSVEIGTNATAGGNGTGQIVNPATNTNYEINISTSQGDAGATRVVILDNVLITASVDTTFTFTVAGLGGGESVNGTTTTGTTTATAIPFGALQAGVANATTSAQRLSVITNASQGYVVTVQVDDTLISSTGADINLFDDGVENDVPATWSSPSGTVGSPDTYGHWGVTSEDNDTTARGGNEFTSDTWIAASTTPRVVMGHNGPANGIESGTSQTDVGYKVEITGLQEAGDDYQAILTYVATPTF